MSGLIKSHDWAALWGKLEKGEIVRTDLHVLHDEIEIARVSVIDDLIEIDEVRMF